MPDDPKEIIQMMILRLVPKYVNNGVRNFLDFFTLLRFEQEGKHLHQRESRFKSIFDIKSYRYYLILEAYENTMYATKKNFVVTGLSM